MDERSGSVVSYILDAVEHVRYMSDTWNSDVDCSMIDGLNVGVEIFIEKVICNNFLIKMESLSIR